MRKDDLESRLARLTCWRGPVTLAPLEGGLTNISYVADDGREKFVVRCGADIPVHHVFRDRERAASIAAFESGLSPEVVHAEPGILVLRFVDGRTFGEADLAVLWDALKGMFDHDRSASRGLMAPRKLIVFKHQNALGNAPAHKLFEALKIMRNSAGDVPRAFTDYTVTLDRSAIPATVEVIEML